MKTLEKSPTTSLAQLQALSRSRRIQNRTPKQSHFEMKAAFESGETMVSIAARHGLSRERIRQILLSNFGLDSKSGGLAIHSKIRAQVRAIKLDENFIKRFGHDYIAHQNHLIEYGYGPTTRWRYQKQSASDRGIDWQFPFADWFSFWLESGHWEERGVRGYVMCRKGDVGPYSRENCYIATSRENIRHYRDRVSKPKKSG
jgi:hypothetical protein